MPNNAPHRTLSILLVLAVAAGWMGAVRLRAQEPAQQPVQPPTQESPQQPVPPPAQQPVPPQPAKPPAPVPIEEQEPFDRIFVDIDGTVTPFDVEPLRFPGNAVPDPLPTEGDLRVRLLSHPDMQFDVAWSLVKQIKRYPRLLIERAEQFRDAGRFDEAFDLYERLRRDYSQTPELEASIQRYLFLNASASFKADRPDDALAILEELRARNSQFPGVDQAIAAVADKLLEMYVQELQINDARQLAERLRADAILGKEPRLLQRIEQLERIAQEKLVEARQRFEAGDYREAYRLTRELLHQWPDFQAVVDLSLELKQKYPRIDVAVAEPALRLEPASLIDGAARRAARLCYRTLTEYRQPGSEGGLYVSPWGNLTPEDDALRWRLRLHHADRPDPALAEVNGYGVSARLVEATDPSRPWYQPTWSRLAGPVRVEQVFDVTIGLRQVYLRPEALWQIPPPSESADEEGPFRNGLGPYLPAETTDMQTHFLLNPRYPLQQAGQPRELVETYFDDPAEAIKALREGQVDAVDDLYPADVALFAGDERYQVIQYAIPSVHVLIPNLDKPFPSQHAFRRAILYGIHRRSILETELLGDQPMPGAQVVTGPMPAGTGPDDPLAYGYDYSLPPQEYEPYLAASLAAVAQSRLRMQAEKTGQPVPELEPITLAHPSDETCRVAAQAIAAHLKAVGIDCRLRPLPPGVARPDDDHWDLLYCRLHIQEPLLDAARLFGPEGLIETENTWLRTTVEQLQSAPHWEQAHRDLLEIHRIVYEDLTVIPLWQIYEHFVVRRDISGLQARPVTLYDNVEYWRP